jgi:SAM-dependent methyltransferase
MEQDASPLRALLRALPVYPMLRRIYQVGAREEEWARVVMNRETHALIGGLSPGHRRALEISGTNWQRLPFKSYRSVQYPECDICASPLDDTFDLILADQVFEHLLWPYRAARNVYTMLNPDGYFLVTTPFLVRVHNMPTDCSRWTEVGIKYFLAECGFPLEHIRTGSWGNRACVRANLSHWSMYRPSMHSLKNEPLFPMVVWALARK